MLLGLCRWIHPASGYRCVLGLVITSIIYCTVIICTKSKFSKAFRSMVFGFHLSSCTSPLVLSIQFAQMEPMVKSVYTTVHRTVRILPVTSLQQMVHVWVESVIQDSRELTAPRVSLIKLCDIFKSNYINNFVTI